MRHIMLNISSMQDNPIINLRQNKVAHYNTYNMLQYVKLQNFEFIFYTLMTQVMLHYKVLNIHVILM